MTTDIIIPPVGESISEGVISSWLKAEGEAVERDEPVLEIETDKITVEVPAPVSGVVHPNVEVGETVNVGAIVGSIDESAAPAAAPAAPANQPAAENSAPAASDQADVRLTPLAKKLAEEHSVNVANITGTGPGGRIREQDILAAVKSPAAKAPAATKAPAAAPASAVPSEAFTRETTRERMSPLRQKIASRLVEAQHTAAMLTTFNECDMTGVMETRKRFKEQFAEKHGIGLGFMSFFMKAAADALQAFPLVNAQLAQGEKGPEIVKHNYCDIAVAVGTPKGLVVPVVRNCESLTFAGIESAIRDLALRARDGKLALEDMQGGTFTISNGGVYGSMLSTPILNPPQSAILGMHNIIRKPVENPNKPGSGEVVVRPIMALALSYDHRIIDGAEAVGFLKRIKECIEDPTRLMLSV